MPAWFDVAMFTIGWSLGWLLLWRRRPLPAGGGVGRQPVSIVVPARNEAHAIGGLVADLVDQVGPDDEIIVVDDRSDDGTAGAAASAGATVISAAPPPPGWLGKPNACLTGRRAATNEILVFVDADVRPRDGFVDAIAAAVARNPDGLTSVQPWHEPGSAAEQLSMFCNVVALTGSGSFSAWGRWVRPTMAFGPVMATTGGAYDAGGGHAHPTVRSRITEDIALARLLPPVVLHAGRGRVSFRMYPGGLSDLVRGWTRTLAAGFGAASPTATVATIGWIWALSAAPFLAWWAYALAAAQVGLLARRAGRFSPLLAAVYPFALAVFVVILIRSTWRYATRRSVGWKGRRVDAR